MRKSENDAPTGPISKELFGATIELKALAGEVTPEVYERLRAISAKVGGTIDHVQGLENCIPVTGN
jgi:hypothetical protein